MHDRLDRLDDADVKVDRSPHCAHTWHSIRATGTAQHCAQRRCTFRAFLRSRLWFLCARRREMPGADRRCDGGMMSEN